MVRKILVASATCAVAAVPASASAAQQDRTTCEKAYSARQVVVKKLGKRAPGRNICRFGMQSRFNRGWSTPASFAEKASYLNKLRDLVYASPYLVAGDPRRPPAGTATPRAGGLLDRIAACESGGSYTAVDPTGKYRGRYQMDAQTWASVGGTGDPAAASPAEQDRRASLLLEQRGTAPWPVCGR